MALTEWQEKEFNDFLKSKKSGVVEFGAPWCGACMASEPQIEKVAEKYDNLEFAKIDVGKNSALASKMGVMSLPNIFVFKEGRVIEQMIGMITADTLNKKLALAE